MADGTAVRVGHEVVGRDEELAAIERWLNDSRPSALLIEGEAGVGKTTLIRAGVEYARQRSLRVLAARPTEAEARLSFAALGDILEGALEDVLGAMPAPQRSALDAALLLHEAGAGATPPDPRAVAVAVLGSLRALARTGPVLVAVDDVQWLDAPSVTTLAFAARRLAAENVCILLARRAGHDDGLTSELEDVERLVLGGLSAGALHRLVRERLDLVVARPALRRLHELSGGNPFYALELATAHMRGQIGLGRDEPLPASLDTLVGHRIASLPEETRQALAAASALSRPMAVLLASHQALAPAMAADVITVEHGEIRFTHPLLASAAYGVLDPETRRTLHARLATLAEDEEERAWHFALSRDAPDEEVARALESAAHRARRRGGGATAAELCESAYFFTPSENGEERGRRAQLAGRYRFLAGDAVGARTMLERALEEPCGPSLRAETLSALGYVHNFEGDNRAAIACFRSALDAAGADAYVLAPAARALAMGLLNARERLDEALALAESAVELAGAMDDDALRAGSLAIQGVLEAVLGRPGARATIALASPEIWDPVRFTGSPAFLRGALDVWTDQPDEGIRSIGDHEKEQLYGGHTPLGLALIALGEYKLGRLDEAARAAGEATEAALHTGLDQARTLALAVRALIESCWGLETEARNDATAAEALAEEQGNGASITISAWALGLLELSLGRPEQTVEVLSPIRARLVEAGVGEPGFLPFFADEVEALVTLGRLEEAEGLLNWFEERAQALDRASALATSARCRGLLAAARGDNARALSELDRALAEHARVPYPFERARTLLALGAARRRAKQKARAREALGQALTLLDDLGARLWSERTQTELAKIGGRTASRDELTPAERRIAELVAAGQTNKEVASALYLSDRTVEGHLTSIYRKLGVRSRAELARTFS